MAYTSVLMKNDGSGSNTTWSIGNVLPTAETLGWTYAGYAFLNWNTESDGSGTTLEPGQDYGTDGAVYYAVWEEESVLAWPTLQYTKDGAEASWTDPSQFPTVESDEITVRADIQLFFDQIKTAFNNLTSILGSASAATLIGAADVEDLKLAGKNYSDNDVTELLSAHSYQILSDGTAVTHTAYPASYYLFLLKGWAVSYSGLRLPATSNVLSFYTSEQESAYVSGVVGAGASTPVSGVFVAPEDGYVRLCTRADFVSSAAVSIRSPLADMLSALGLLGQELSSVLSTDGAISTSGVAYTASGYSRSDYIAVRQGWLVNYQNMTNSTGNNIISFYTGKSASDYMSGVAGSGGSTPVSGVFTVPADGYIRLCNRTDGLSTCSVIVTTSPAVYPEKWKYVSPTGDDSNTGDTYNSAYATVAKALSENAYDIFLADGEYSEVLSITKRCRIHARNAVFNISSASDAISATGLVYLEIEGVTINFVNVTGSVSGFHIRNTPVILRNCHVNNAPYMGFRLDGSFAILEQCSAVAAGVDGFNAHDTTGHTSEGMFINCVAKSCGDDGLSYHENGVIHVLGGEYAQCTSTGIAPHNNCNCDIKNAYIHDNTRAGIEALVGTYTTPDPLPLMVLSGCIFENNGGNAVTAEHYRVKAVANGASGNGTDSIVNAGSSDITIFSMMS